ncbi:hypothetical protein C2R22_24290 (plasmid) [Salinigranum rubrum]|uniref:ATP-dependent acyl-CoA ligase n=1 Tax=Salinigranum rubrum TaxID=755307 RepID=A0A2I8VRX3_9EURY|nr:AMP-binding protein [Salinigranum rubrum]AUV84652.1 hypothetical protein C2R22_24290 [Salinigranum rubrum]
MNVVEWFNQRVQQYGAHTFIEFPDEQASYREVSNRGTQIARLLTDQGIEDDDTVLLFLPNCIEYVTLLFGIPKVGGVAASLNTKFRRGGLEHLIRKSDADLTFVSDTLLSRYDSAAKRLDQPPSTVVVVEKRGGQEEVDVTSATCAGTLADLRARYDTEPIDSPEMKPGHPLALIHTSGTTGLPKWCQLSHQYAISAGTAISETAELTNEDRIFDPLAMYHLSPQILHLYGTVHAGATAIKVEQFSASAFWEQVVTFDPSVLLLHLGMIDILKTQPVRDIETQHAVRLVQGGDREFLDRFEIPATITGYGSTEAGAWTSLTTISKPYDNIRDDEKLTQMGGVERDDMEVRFFDENDHEVETGKPGEIVVRPTEPHVIFDGYYNDAEKTVDAWQNLWFHTGDLGYRDVEGRIHFLERMEDSIRVRGEFVNIELVETCIGEIPGVDAVAVIGVPAEVGDEEIKAVIQLADGVDLSPETIVEACETELPGYMVPRYVEFVDAIPRGTAIGKIQKAKLSRDVGAVWDRRV